MLATGDIADDGAGGVGTSVPEGTMGGVANFVRGTNLAPGAIPVSSLPHCYDTAANRFPHDRVMSGCENQNQCGWGFWIRGSAPPGQ